MKAIYSNQLSIATKINIKTVPLDPMSKARGLRGTFGHLWARGYFAASSGNVTDEVIMQYIEEQDLIERARCDDFFSISLSRLQAAVGYKPPPSRRLLIDFFNE